MNNTIKKATKLTPACPTSGPTAAGRPRRDHPILSSTVRSDGGALLPSSARPCLQHSCMRAQLFGQVGRIRQHFGQRPAAVRGAG